jgi:hypothetical protein
VVVPELAKHLLSLNFTGNDQDNLAEGVQPFLLTNVDHRSQTSREAMRVGRDGATNYDLKTTGQANTSLSDAKSLRGCTRAHASLDMIHAKAILEATLLVLRKMFESDHHLVISASSFMASYNSDRLAIQHRLALHEASHYEAKCVRYLGLRLTNRFLRMELSPLLIGAPYFEQIFD